jgi:hypothetical protein
MANQFDSLVEKRTCDILSYMNPDDRTYIDAYINSSVEKKVALYEYRSKAISFITVAGLIILAITSIVLVMIFAMNADNELQIKKQYEERLDKIENRCIEQVVCDCLPE